jgi:hypothetical protein
MVLEVTKSATMTTPNGIKRETLGQDAQVEAIDLTLSSSDTELRSRPSQQKQKQNFSSYIKSESRSESGSTRQVKREHRTPGRPSQARTPTINPQHLERIIETSSPQSLRKVLIELCKLSPALSGAVARGLATHSTFAQDIIRQHRQTSRPSGSRSVRTEESSDPDVRERMKQRLAATRHPAHRSSFNRIRSPSGVRPGRPGGSHSVPRIKHEPQISLEDSDSDLDQYIPRDFPVVGPITPSRLPLRHASKSNTTNNTPRFPSSQLKTSLHENLSKKRENKICTRCQETFSEDPHDVCFYHPGPQRRVDGVDTCTRCDSPWDDLGCILSTHVASSDTNLDPFKRNQPDRSQSPSKRPRII